MFAAIHRQFSLRHLLIGVIFFSTDAVCQKSRPDSLFVLNAVNHAKGIYQASIGAQSHLYNGVRYKDWEGTPNDEGHPYFQSDDWVEGTVEYDGESHIHVFILYNLVTDKVIIEHGMSGNKLQLIDAKLKRFTIPGHRFEYLHGDSLKNSPIQRGFYDLLSDGKVKFYAKWHKERAEVIEDLQVRSVFRDKNSFFVWKDGSYFQVQSKSSLLKVLQDNKALRKFIRKNNISFRTNRVNAIARVVSFYNESRK